MCELHAYTYKLTLKFIIYPRFGPLGTKNGKPIPTIPHAIVKINTGIADAPIVSLCLTIFFNNFPQQSQGRNKQGTYE